MDIKLGNPIIIGTNHYKAGDVIKNATEEIKTLCDTAKVQYEIVTDKKEPAK